MPIATDTELSVRSESIQSLYLRYRADKFIVNRRYQRKLVWTLDEKEKLIDSALQNLPLPLFLVAEIGIGADSTYEVIDGMQRLNALFAFLENEYKVGGHYFDLDALADTKSLKDSGFLVQREPIMSRDQSVRLSNYSVALSVFRSTESSSVDEVFRRINSGGRRLSFQELRQAGTISQLADLVRILSSRIRTDTSPSDSVPLRVMPKLSITNRDLDYGVRVNDIFWVRHGVLRGEDVRTSLDEQLILDMLIDCVISPIPTISKEGRDAYYGFSDKASSSPSDMDASIAAYDPEKLQRDFMSAYDACRSFLDDPFQRFATLIGVKSGGRSPRYFHAVFIAIFELMFQDAMRIKDPALLAEKIQGIATSALKIPGGSGTWTTESRRKSVDAVKGVVRSVFEQAIGEEDLAQYGWASQLDTLLGNAAVEQQMFECKQGLHRLDEARSIDPNIVDKIGRTASAMANCGRGAVGYIILGVADKQADTDRIRDLDRVTSIEVRGFQIVGIQREALLRDETMSDYWKWLTQKISSNIKMEKSLREQVAVDARLAVYRHHSVGILKVVAGLQPLFYDGALYERQGSETKLVDTASYGRLFGRFVASTA